MLKLLIRRFIKDKDNVNDPGVREAYGALAGVIGIIFNALLFGVKYFAGALSGSIAIIADAFNNLSDAGSSVITMLGFRLAGKRPHSDHPFGHGRMEYIAGLAVSFIIIMMGFDLAKTSVMKIIEPAAVEFSGLAFAILSISVIVKLYMALYNRALARKLNSVAMRATAIDSLSDACSTFAVMISMIIARLTHVALDGWIGALVSLMIMFSGVKAARDTISPLLGNAPDAKFVEAIYSIVKKYPVVTGVHDLVVHDYGAGRRMISLHAEVRQDGDLLETHDAIDLIERELTETLSCHAVIHMDPLATDDKQLSEARAVVTTALINALGDISVHDFRMVSGPTHTNVIFDVVLPADAKIADKDAQKRAEQAVLGLPGNYRAVVNIDRAFLRRGH